MLGAKLILSVVLCQVQAGDASQDPAALVAQLGSARYADREAAAQALERIGRPPSPPCASLAIRTTPRYEPGPGSWRKRSKMPC